MSPSPLDRRSLVLAALSTVVEWYDFTLFLYLATLLSRLFFIGRDALLVTLGGFAVAYLMRPLGALVFGHFGDRHGRRATLIGSMALMTAAMTATALLPTAAQVGPAAGFVLLLLRCIMGFAVGGEYTGVVAYLLEGSPPHRRGLITSLAAATSEIGALLAAAVAALTVTLIPAPALEDWGWRIPFLFGAALAALILFARSAMRESPDFEAERDASRLLANPIGESWARHRAGVLRGFAISALGSITYYVGITYVPVYLTATTGMEEGMALQLATIAAVAVILVTPVVGLLADRWGRRLVLVALATVAAIVPWMVFRAFPDAGAAGAIVGAVLLAALAGGVSAVGAVATAEQLPAKGRLSGLALGATSATALFGGLTPWLAQWLTVRTGTPQAPGIMIAIVAVAVLPVLLTLPDPSRTRRHDLR